MVIVRTLLCVIVALSIGFGPFGAALAAGQREHVNADARPGSIGHGHEAAAMGDMESGLDMAAGMADCHKDLPSKSGCTCCDTKAKCPGPTCAMTCCKVIGVNRPIVFVRVIAAIHYRPLDPLKPPNWVAEPSGPPPRS